MNSKLLKILDEKFVNVIKELKGVPYKTIVGSFIYAMVATKVWYLIYGEYGEPIHVKGRSSSLDGRETHHEVFDNHLDFKLCHGGKDIILEGFCDADWTGDTNDRRFIMGFVFFVGVEIISWKCKKQQFIALSTTEA